MCYSKFVLFFVKYFQLSEMFYGGNNGRDMRRFLKKKKGGSYLWFILDFNRRNVEMSIFDDLKNSGVYNPDTGALDSEKALQNAREKRGNLNRGCTR